MKIYLIVFQSSPDSFNKIILKIKYLGAWAKIADTVYAIKCENILATEIRDDLSNEFRENTRFFVVDITNSAWASYSLPKAVTDWLKS